MSPNDCYLSPRSEHPQGEREPEVPSAKGVIANSTVLPLSPAREKIAEAADAGLDKLQNAINSLSTNEVSPVAECPEVAEAEAAAGEAAAREQPEKVQAGRAAVANRAAVRETAEAAGDTAGDTRIRGWPESVPHECPKEPGHKHPRTGPSRDWTAFTTATGCARSQPCLLGNRIRR